MRVSMRGSLVITGASRGIGKETAALFSKAGWLVVNLSRHPCEIADVTNIAVDLSCPDWENLAQDSLLKALPPSGKICIVHNSALNTKDNVQNLQASAFREILELNLITPLKLNQLLLKNMLPGSSIIYMGSTLSEKAVKNAASYVITKHALVGLMRSTCQDLAGTGIHTACICPGFTDTEMLRDHLGQNPEILESISNRVGAKRLINPLEIAELILFCANHEVINGSVLHANLGQIEN